MIAFIFLASLFLSAIGCSRQSAIVTAIAVHPSRPEIVYVVTNDGIYKTRDGGRSWASITEGLGAARVLSIAVHPVYTSTVFAGTLGDSVYRSMTGGQDWGIANAGMKEHVAVVNAFVFDPREKDTLYAATTVGIFKSLDNGMLWDAVPNKGLNSIYVVSLVLDRANPDILYAGTSGGVYRSPDGGQTWEPASKGMVQEGLKTALSLGINGILQDPQDPRTLYAASTRGIFKTMDQAATWAPLPLGEGNDDLFISSLAMDPVHSQTLYAGTVKGIFKSTDGGVHWTAMNAGLTNTNVRSLAIEPSRPGTLYAGTHGGLFQSLDGAITWRSLPFYRKSP